MFEKCSELYCQICEEFIIIKRSQKLQAKPIFCTEVAWWVRITGKTHKESTCLGIAMTKQRLKNHRPLYSCSIHRLTTETRGQITALIPNLQFAMRLVPHGLDISIPTPSENCTSYYLEEALWQWWWRFHLGKLNQPNQDLHLKSAKWLSYNGTQALCLHRHRRTDRILSNTLLHNSTFSNCNTE